MSLIQRGFVVCEYTSEWNVKKSEQRKVKSNDRRENLILIHDLLESGKGSFPGRIDGRKHT